MRTFHFEVQIDRDPADVWAYLADPSKADLASGLEHLKTVLESRAEMSKATEPIRR